MVTLVVAERSHPISEVHGSYPVMGKILYRTCLLAANEKWKTKK